MCCLDTLTLSYPEADERCERKCKLTELEAVRLVDQMSTAGNGKLKK